MKRFPKRSSKPNTLVSLELLGACLILSSMVVTTACSVGTLNDDLSYHVLTASSLGQGDSIAVVPSPEGAFAVNPASAIVNSPVWAIHSLRTSHRVMFFQHWNASEQYNDYLRYERNAVGIQSLVHLRPFGRGNLGLNISLQHEGDFQRVNTEGKQVNSFPASIWSWGIGYNLRAFHGLQLGADARRVRINPLEDQTSDLGWGYIYSAGLTEALGDHLVLGVVGRNLTNGVSLHLSDDASDIEPQMHVGVAVERLFADRLRLTSNWTFPAHEGMRIGAGAELAPWEWLRLQIGYVNDEQRRSVRMNDLEAFDGTATKLVERLFVKRGITLGMTISLPRLMMSLAWAPQHYPRPLDDEVIRVESGESQIALSVAFRREGRQ